MSFTVGEHSARHVRRIVALHLLRWRMVELMDPAKLAVTELLSNVVRHVPDRHCELVIRRQTGGVRVEVTDGCPELPLPCVPDFEKETGRGLVLLDAAVGEWGVEPRSEGGKTVWFECWVGAGREFSG
ncbi:ATP-binding protein [Streptomyces tailanensis]|uniref:ATP-binding protein n=1 Tax=Streptomyces tailanensis TaxID=2569858 RepID=UPI00122E8F4B|nr:ATP-binding protein [Streptomyces tailanensis]